jgi:hypothetical protein
MFCSANLNKRKLPKVGVIFNNLTISFLISNNRSQSCYSSIYSYNTGIVVGTAMVRKIEKTNVFIYLKQEHAVAALWLSKAFRVTCRSESRAPAG